MKWLRAGSAALVVFALAGCESFKGLTDLDVINENAADRERVLQTWGDNENFMFGSFNAIYSAYANGYPAQAMTTMADEQTASWGNYDARALSSEPRVPFNNSPAYRFNNHAETPWYNTYEGLSNLYDGLRAIDQDTTGLACEEVDCDRLRAYSKLVQGIGHAYLAMFFDSAFILDETIELFADDGSEISQVFVAYPGVWAAAEGYFAEAKTLAAGGTWNLPTNVFGLTGNLWNGAELIQVANTLLAHYEPMMARDEAERTAVDWGDVMANAAAGMPGDLFLEGDGADIWDNNFLYFSQITTSTTWNRADYKTIGQYDENLASTGTYGYQDWLSEAVPARNEFAMVGHPDNRIVGAGDTDGTTDGITFRYRGASAFPSSRGTYHYSFYSHGRFEGFPATETGPMPWVLREGVMLNRAEGIVRTGGINAEVVSILDATRGPAGLPTVAGYTDAQAMDAIVYERRIENFGWCWGCAYFNARGEGPLAPSRGTAGGGMDQDGAALAFHHQGLVEGTPKMFAPPGKELEVLEIAIWTYGGIGNELGQMNAGRALGASAVYDADRVGTHSIQAFYVPAEESLRRKAERVSRGKALVRYIQ